MENNAQKKDLLEIGAIVQRDRETFAIAPHIPGGITNAETLRKLADIADKYGAKAIKVTSAQRIALVGLPEESIEAAWEDLGMAKGHALGYCVRSVKVCPGTTFCKRAQQDSVALGLELDKRYHGYELPSKCKIGVSGCPNSCSENAIKDLGIMGNAKGFSVMVGGSAGVKPRLAEVIATGKAHEEVLELTQEIFDFYKALGKVRERMGQFLDRVGVDNLKAYLDADKVEKEKILASLA